MAHVPPREMAMEIAAEVEKMSGGQVTLNWEITVEDGKKRVRLFPEMCHGVVGYTRSWGFVLKYTNGRIDTKTVIDTIHGYHHGKS